MVEFVEGSGFYPPTFNSFTGNAGEIGVSIGNETKTYTIMADDRVELSSLAFFHRMTSSNSSAGGYTVNIRLSNNLITSYVLGAQSADVGTYIDTLIQNTSIIMNKNDKLIFEIIGSGLSGGQGVHTISVTIFGKFVL